MMDYETTKHGDFAFIKFQTAEDAAAAIDNMKFGLKTGKPSETTTISPCGELIKKQLRLENYNGVPIVCPLIPFFEEFITKIIKSEGSNSRFSSVLYNFESTGVTAMVYSSYIDETIKWTMAAIVVIDGILCLFVRLFRLHRQAREKSTLRAPTYRKFSNIFDSFEKKNMNTSKRNRKNGEETNANRVNTIMIVERDMVRKLIVPRNANRKVTTLLSESQFSQIKENSRLISGVAERKEDNGKKQLEDEQRKCHELRQELEKLKNERTAEIDEEERRRNEEILARSEELKREEEDLIKKCNSLILSIKCKAIQDSQVAEKELIRRQLKEQDHLMDCEMEDEQKRLQQNMQKTKEENWARRREYAKSVMEQIKHNEDKRTRQMQMMRNENKALKLKAQKEDDEEMQQFQRRSAARLNVKRENERINDEIKKNKEKERELEKLESLKIQEYMKRKLREEKELGECERKEKQLQERELARLWKLQKTSRSLLQSKDEIMQERIQEQIQRKWRQNELEKIRKKIREIEEVKNIREKQIQEKRKSLMSKTVEKNEEAEKMTAENQKLIETVDALRCRQKEVTEKYKTALKDQINEKERKKKKQREEILEEGKDLLTRIQKQDQIIKETMKKKIDQIRSANIPEIYVKNLEKRMQLT